MHNPPGGVAITQRPAKLGHVWPSIAFRGPVCPDLPISAEPIRPTGPGHRHGRIQISIAPRASWRGEPGIPWRRRTNLADRIAIRPETSATAAKRHAWLTSGHAASLAPATGRPSAAPMIQRFGPGHAAAQRQGRRTGRRKGPAPDGERMGYASPRNRSGPSANGRVESATAVTGACGSPRSHGRPWSATRRDPPGEALPAAPATPASPQPAPRGTDVTAQSRPAPPTRTRRA